VRMCEGVISVHDNRRTAAAATWRTTHGDAIDGASSACCASMWCVRAVHVAYQHT
jgi:hypothetical protein